MSLRTRRRELLLSELVDSSGIVLVGGGNQHPSAPGLFFNGYRPDLSGHLRPMRAEARAIARTVRRIHA